VSASDAVARPAPEAPGAGEARRLELKAVPREAGEWERLGGGETVRFGEESKEPPAQRDHEAAREASARIVGWVEESAARQRAEIGLVDPYYGELARALRRETEHAPVVSDPSPVLGPLAKSWAEQAARYGATGNPFTPEESPGRHSLPAIPGLNRLPLTAADLLSDIPVTGLVALVELTQQADGRLKQSVLLRSSGSHDFDTYVLGAVPAAVAGLAPPPDGGLALHPEGLRSVWSFEGRITFEHRWKDFRLLDDGWYALLATPATLMSGRFDLVTGEGGFIDLRMKKMLCKVTLVRAY
jgi:hypothetical protein